MKRTISSLEIERYQEDKDCQEFIRKKLISEFSRLSLNEFSFEKKIMYSFSHLFKKIRISRSIAIEEEHTINMTPKKNKIKIQVRNRVSKFQENLERFFEKQCIMKPLIDNTYEY